jgi:drug/metabolite transporter (DMT)-like permease
MTAMERNVTDPQKPKSSRNAIAWLFVGLIAAIFFAGATAGFLDALAKDGKAPISSVFGAAIVGLTISVASIMLFAPSLSAWQDLSPRRRLYWSSLGGAALVGGIIGMLLQLDGSVTGPETLFGDAPLSPNFALAAAALWAVGIAGSCLAYHRAIDDHEERAWLWAGLAGWYAFIVPAPAWWVLHRASIAPPVDAMMLFFVSMLVNAAVWLWLKFR